VNEKVYDPQRDNAERAAAPPLRAAPPKGATKPTPHDAPGAPAEPQAKPEHWPEPTSQSSAQLREALRQSVALVNPDPLDAIRDIADVLRPFDADTRRKIIETLADLT